MSGGGGHGGHGKKGGHHEEHEEHEEHVNHEAWVIPYADMLTLLMALFLVLFALGRTDLEKFKKLAESFREEFGGGAGTQVVSISDGSGNSPLDGGSGVLDANGLPSTGEGTGQGDGTGMATPTELQIEQARQEAVLEDAQGAKDALEAVEQAIEDAARAEGFGDSLAFTFNGKGLVLNVVNSALLFDSGQASLKPEGIEILRTIAPALRDIPNDLKITGHTDNVPFSSGRYRDNNELSAARANSVKLFLGMQGVESVEGGRKVEIAGAGPDEPIADNGTPEGRAQNRRVEIIILSDISLDPALEAEADIDA